MAKGKRKPVDPLAQAIKENVRSKGYTLRGQRTKAAKKEQDKAVADWRQQQTARMFDFESDYYDSATDSFPALENLSNPDHPEYDPEYYNEILKRSGIDPSFLQDVGLSPIDVTGDTRDISRGTSEDIGDVEDYEDIENQDLSGSNLLSGAISQILGKQSKGGGGRVRGRTITGLEEGGAAARSGGPSRAPQPTAPTSSRRSTVIPRAKTVKDVVEEQKLWAGETRSGKPQRPYVQPQGALISGRDPLTGKPTKVFPPGKDLGSAAITAVPEAREAREENKVRLMVGTFNELVARENEALGVASGSKESMTIPVGGSGSAPQPAATPAPVTPPTPGRVIRSSNAAGRPAPTVASATAVSLGDVTGASALTPPPAPEPGRPVGPRRTRINRVPSGDTERTGAVNPSGMSPQLQRFLRDNQMAGILGAGSRSGGAMVKGADAVTRRMGGVALGPVTGSWDVSTDPATGKPKPVDRNNPATKVIEVEPGKFKLENELQIRTDPMDPEYTPYTHGNMMPVSAVSGPEGEQKERERQAAVIKSGKPASFTGRRPSTSKNPLPGPTVMEQSTADIYGPDIEAVARAAGTSNYDAARRIAAAVELQNRKEDIITEGTEAVVTSGEELNINRAKRGTVTSVKGQMTRVPKAGGGSENFRTNIPTAEELIGMFPQKDGEEKEAYVERLSQYLTPKMSVLSPEELAQREADQEAAKKASRNAGMPKRPSKAQQARDRKANEERIARDTAPAKAYKALREGADAEYDTAGFIRAHEALPSSTTGLGLSPVSTDSGVPVGGIPRPDTTNAQKNLGFLSRMIGADVEQFDLDRESLTNPGIEARSEVTGDTIRPSSSGGFNQRYKVQGPSGAITANPTGNPFFKNVNESQFGGYRSQSSTFATSAPDRGPAPQGPSPEQLMESTRRADAAVAARRSGGFARTPLTGETMSDMARRVSVGMGNPGFRQVGRSLKSERKAARKGLISGGQFGQAQVEPGTEA